MSKRMRINTSQVARAALVACLLLASSGCSFFTPSKKRDAQLPNPQGASYTVEYHPYRSKGWEKKFAITGPTYVTDALQQARASGKAARAKVSVMRNVDGTNRVVAMAVEMKRKRVAPNTDYALHDGDRVVIREDVNGPVDKLLGFMPAF